MSRSASLGVFVMAVAVMTWSDCPAQSLNKKAVLVERNVDLNKVICGPRCVKHVLDYYGHNAEISDLVRELQWPKYQNGTTMAALAKSLEKRGVHVRAVVVPKAIPLDWAYPLILHFANEPIGHFAVLSPSKGGVTLWSNERREEFFSSGPCFNKRTETVLLTSDREITDDDLARIAPHHLGGELWLAGLPFFPFLLLIPWKKIGKRFVARKFFRPDPATDSLETPGNSLFTRKEGEFMRSRCLSLVLAVFVGFWLVCSARFIALTFADGMSVTYAVSLDDPSLQAAGGQIAMPVTCWQGDKDVCEGDPDPCSNQLCTYNIGAKYWYCYGIANYVDDYHLFYWNTFPFEYGYAGFDPFDFLCEARVACNAGCLPKNFQYYCAYGPNWQNVLFLSYQDAFEGYGTCFIP